jgi:putative transposase
MSRELVVTPEPRLLECEIKAIHAESKKFAGARSIATIASERGFALSRYRATRLMKKLGFLD